MSSSLYHPCPAPAGNTMSTDVVIKNYLIPIPALDHRELSSLEMFHIFRDGVSSDDNVVVKSLQDCHHLFVRNPYVLNGHTQKYFRIPQFHSLQLELDPDVLSYLLRCTSQDVPDDMGTYQGLRVTTSGLVVRHMSFSEFPLGDLFCFALWIRQTIVAPLDKDPAAMQLSLISCWFMNLHDLLCFLRELQFDLLVAWNIQLKEPLEAICQHANTIKTSKSADTSGIRTCLYFSASSAILASSPCHWHYNPLSPPTDIS
ncbi:hypothetical protein CERSUDRAFT_118255 [Gelatoporia subvermispora B]|uniref:Uncharacterized protein n=1 Tax=Ceriporiopsis subvermispora (strain B) TaxID=914234 RepID=M2R4R3_CERS8|nr:hypothetical protein CERSUDRAFT_118255 [Gelatoporia subvermispora B]